MIAPPNMDGIIFGIAISVLCPRYSAIEMGMIPQVYIQDPTRFFLNKTLGEPTDNINTHCIA